LYLSSYNFIQEITAQVRVWLIPLCRAAQEESKKIICPFWTFLQGSTNFRNLNCFMLFKINGKVFKSRAQYWAGNWPGATVRGVVACYGRWVPRRGGPSGGLARPSRLPTVRAGSLRPKSTRWHERPRLTDGSLGAGSRVRA
jgi:hypothetical protein